MHNFFIGKRTAVDNLSGIFLGFPIITHLLFRFKNLR